MKTALTYGVIMAVAGAVLTLLMYLAGFQESAEKLQAGQWIGIIGGLTIAITCLSLAMRERRAAVAARGEREWGYRPALGVGILTGLFGSLLGAIFAYVYFSIINPGLGEVMLELQLEKLSDKLNPSQLERVEPSLRKWMSPPIITALQALSGFLWSILLAILVAIFHRKPVAGQADPDIPPALG